MTTLWADDGRHGWTTTPWLTTSAMAEEPAGLPGEGVDVIAGRANWSSGYFQRELYKLLLEELGYNVSNPAEVELGPSNGYTAMALGEMGLLAQQLVSGPPLVAAERASRRLAGGGLRHHRRRGDGRRRPAGIPGHQVLRRRVRRLHDGRVEPQRRCAGRVRRRGCSARQTASPTSSAVPRTGLATTSSRARSRSATGATSRRPRPATTPCSPRRWTALTDGKPMVMYTWTPDRVPHPAAPRRQTCTGWASRTSSTTPIPSGSRAERPGASSAPTVSPSTPSSARNCVPRPLTAPTACASSAGSRPTSW